MIPLLIGLACSGPDRAALDWTGPTTSQGPGNEPTVAELGGPHDTLVIALLADVGTLLPVVSTTATEFDVLYNLNRLLFTRSFDCGMQYSPGIAESWHFNEDSTILTTVLRDDITWSDGTPFSVQDLVFTYELIADPSVASPRIDYIERMVPGAMPRVIDDRTVEWHFTTPYSQTIQLSHVSLVPTAPRHALADADRATLRGHAFGNDPIVTGPWEIEQWKPKQKLVLVPDPDFAGPEELRPRLKRVVYKVLPEYATRLVELENGSIDLATSLQVEDADRLAIEHPELDIIERGWRATDFLAWNSLDPADYDARSKAKEPGTELDWSTVKRHRYFGDARVRRALSKAIDVDKMMKDLLGSAETGIVHARRAVSTITPELCEFVNDDIPLVAYDPAKARAELEALGWADTDGDGVLERDGEPFVFTLVTNSGNPRRAKASILLQAMFADVGVKVEIEKTEANTFFSNLRKKQFDAALSGWSAGLYADMTSIWHSGDRYELNYPSYDNPEVDALIEAAMAEPDPARNADLLREAQALIYADQPYTFLYWRNELDAVHTRFRDAKVNVLNHYHDLHSWWVPPSDVKYWR